MSPRLSELPPPPLGRTGWPWSTETPPSDAGTIAASWPRITIVTPSFNQALYLEEAIRSVLLQSYPNLQYIVIDGGSTDGSQAIIAKYAPWLDYWVSEPDRGQSHAINKGLSRATGEWFNWINSDDCLSPGALAAVAAADRPGAQLISGAQVTGPTLAAATPLGRTRIGPTCEDALVNHFICQQGLFFKTAIIQAIHGVREDLHYVMDLDLFARLLLEGGPESIVETPATLALFRRHNAAKTSIAADRFRDEELRLFAGLGRSAGLRADLLAHLPADHPLEFSAAATARLDRTRLGQLLARKYWWDGTVERCLRERSYAEFRREARAFIRAYPELREPRISKLHFLASLPEPFLRLLSRFRADPS